MLKHNYGEMYLRRMKPTDKADSIFTATSMAAKEMIRDQHDGRAPIVAVRRGFPGEVIAVGYTKEDVRRQFSDRPFKEVCQWFRQPMSTE